MDNEASTHFSIATGDVSPSLLVQSFFLASEIPPFTAGDITKKPPVRRPTKEANREVHRKYRPSDQRLWCQGVDKNGSVGQVHLATLWCHQAWQWKILYKWRFY